MKSALSTLILRLFGALPLWCCQWLGLLLGNTLYYVANNVREQTQKNIARCLPSLDKTAQANLVKQSLQHTSMSMLEMTHQWHTSPVKNLKRVQTVHGQALLQQPASRIIITPHFGNWELLGTWLATQTSLTAMYKPAKQAPLNRLIIKGREAAGIDLASIDVKGLRKLTKALKSQQSIAILPDQEPPLNAGIETTFFGQPAYTMTLVSQLIKVAQGKNATPQILLGWAKRLGIGKGFAIELFDVSEPLLDPKLSTSVQAMNDVMAELISQHPEQYQWEYKRFKHTLGD